MSEATASDADLLGRIAGQREDPVQAREAWGELYSRHRRYLYVVVKRAYGSFLGEDGVTDLVVDAFRRAYEWSGRQACAADVRARFTAHDDETTRRRVLGWLGAIAERLFKDRFRKDATSASRLDEYVDDLRRSQASDSDSPAELTAVRRVREALATLDQKDQDVLRLSLPWYEPGTRSFAVPRGEGTRLASMIGLSPDAFRQRRHRALRKLELHLQEGKLIEVEQRQ